MIRFFSNLNVARKISLGFTLIFILMVIVCIIVYFSITAINTVLDMNTQIGTAAQEQSAVTQEVSKEIANLSSKLQRLVSQFKVWA